MGNNLTEKNWEIYLCSFFSMSIYIYLFFGSFHIPYIYPEITDAYLVTYYYYILIRLYIWSFDWFQMTSEKYKYVVDEWSRKKIFIFFFSPMWDFFINHFDLKKQRMWYAKLWYYVVITNCRQKKSVELIYISVFHEFLNPE